MFLAGSDEDIENENENENFFMQALPVGDLQDQNLNEPPKTGEEYLSRVRLEASKCPKVVVANTECLKIKPIVSSQIIPEFESKIETREEFLSTVEWQREKSAEFAALRLMVEKNRSSFEITQKYNIPKSTKSEDWFKFCFGVKPISTDNTNIEDEESISIPQDPLLSLLYTMEQSAIVQLFDYQVEWFEKYGWSDAASKWIYALMAFIEKPLLPETYSALRNLARTCATFRAKLESPNDKSLNTLNLFIALVGRYFEQMDLLNE